MKIEHALFDFHGTENWVPGITLALNLAIATNFVEISSKLVVRRSYVKESLIDPGSVIPAKAGSRSYMSFLDSDGQETQVARGPWMARSGWRGGPAAGENLRSRIP